MFEKAINATYYNTEDIMNVIRWVRFDLPELLIRDNPNLAQARYHEMHGGESNAFDCEGKYQELHVRLFSGTVKTSVSNEVSWIKDDQDEDVPATKLSRLCINLRRRTELADNDLEKIALLAQESPVIPRNVIEDLVVHLCSDMWNIAAILTFIKPTGQPEWGYNWRYKALRRLVEQFIPKDLNIRIETRAAKGSRKQARMVTLNDRVRRRSNSIQWQQHKIKMLEKSIAQFKSKLDRLQKGLNDDLTELQKLEEE